MLDCCACVGVTVHISKFGGLQSREFDDAQNPVGGQEVENIKWK